MSALGHKLLTKAHSRSRKRLIGRLLNPTERNCTYDRDGDCPNACKDEGSHDQPSLCLRDGSIRISRKGLYSHLSNRRRSADGALLSEAPCLNRFLGTFGLLPRWPLSSRMQRFFSWVWRSS